MLREAKREVCGALHDAERRRAKPDAREVERENRRHHFVTDVGDERREHNSERTERHPARENLIRRLVHALATLLHSIALHDRFALREMSLTGHGARSVLLGVQRLRAIPRTHES